MSKTVMILSGIPGSGKSTFANERKQGIRSATFSADHYFLDGDGNYSFDLSKLGVAHATCMHNFLKALGSWESGLLIVDNTNIHNWERMNYEHAARIKGWEVEQHFFVARTVSDVKVCHSRNTHDVPIGIVLQMAAEHEIPELAPRIFHYSILTEALQG